MTLSDYIHLNPVRAGAVNLEDTLFSYRWSSYPWYAAREGRPNWLETGRVLGELGLEDTKAGRRAYAQRMRARAVEEREEKNSRPALSYSVGGVWGAPASASGCSHC